MATPTAKSKPELTSPKSPSTTVVLWTPPPFPTPLNEWSSQGLWVSTWRLSSLVALMLIAPSRHAAAPPRAREPHTLIRPTSSLKEAMRVASRLVCVGGGGGGGVR